MAITSAISDFFQSLYELLSSVLGSAYSLGHSILTAVFSFVGGLLNLAGNVAGGLVDIAGGVGKFVAGESVLPSPAGRRGRRQRRISGLLTVGLRA